MSAENTDQTAGSLLPREDIAIVGMACTFAGAANLQAYWNNIVSKVDAIGDPPADWGPDYLVDPDTTDNDRICSRHGGFLGDLARFDPMSFGVMPRSVDGSEPDHYLALQLASDALVDAGYGEAERRPSRERMEIILGRGTYINRGWTTLAQHGLVVDQTIELLRQLHPEHTEAELQAIRRELKESLPPFNAETAPGMVPNIITGRIANRLDFMGPNFIVDAACASSLVALELGVRDLLLHTCDMALVGGVQASTPPPLFMIFAQLGALSRSGQIRAFDKNADGTLLGEGAGIVVLKRLADAERDGDRIYACIKGVGSSSDGRGAAVLTPRLEGEVLSLQRAYQAAQISPSTIELIEAHGTGTVVGDITEIQTLRQVFGPRQRPYPSIAVGSVKTMISHAIPAAGIAGLIKAALALYHGVLPPTLHCDEPNPRFELHKTPLYINTETRPWIHGAADYPRRAAVNAFGFGGINVHAILEEHAPSRAGDRINLIQEWESEALILEADSRAGLIEQARRLQEALSAAPAVSLKDLAYTLNSDLSNKPYRLALVALSLDDAAAKLARAQERLSDPTRTQIKDRGGIYYFEEPFGRTHKLAFLFPGEGAQYVNMLSDLCLHFPEVRAWFDRIDGAFLRRGQGDLLPSQLVFPPPAPGSPPSAGEPGGKEDRLWEIEGAVAAVTTADWAILSLLERLGLHPHAVLGHSSGEFAALQAAGIMDMSGEGRFEECVFHLGGLYQRVAAEDGVPRAALIAVAADSEAVAEVTRQVDGDLHIAMANCPHQTVVVGQKEAVERAIDLMRQRGLIYEELRFDRPYHSPLFESYAQTLRPFFDQWLVSAPRVPLYSCTTMAPYPDSLVEIRDLALRHWVQPMDFWRTIEAMYADGVRIFLEVGPRGNLTAFVDDILYSQPHLAVASNVPSRSGITQINHVVALLAAHGIGMQLAPLYERRVPKKLSLDALPDRARPEAGRGTTMKLSLGLPRLELQARDRGAAQAGAATPFPALPAIAPHPERVPEAPPPDRQAVPPMAERGVPHPARPEDLRLSPPAAGHLAAHTAKPAPADLPRLAGGQGGTGRAPLVMGEYLRAMERFLEVQQEVMQAYLTGATLPGGVIPSSAPDRVPAAIPSAVAPAPVPVAPAAPAEPEAAKVESVGERQPPVHTEGTHPAEPAAALELEAIGRVLLTLVSEKTGYPAEMIDSNLDLEADLGIDSIKRVEIIGAFQKATGIRLGDKMEQLAARKTLQGIIEFLADFSLAAGEGGAPLAPAAPTEPSAGGVEPLGEAPALGTAKGARPGEPAATLESEAIGQVLLTLVSEKTGYPVEMIDPKLDLEADLGIDSIKRVEIISAFQKATGIRLGDKMEQLAARKTLQGIIAFLADFSLARSQAGGGQENAVASPEPAPGGGPAAGAHPLRDVPPLPFMGNVLTLTPGEELVAHFEISLESCPFLHDHVLGRNVALTDKGLSGLPVMPLTMSMEIMAEAAARLLPGRLPIGMKEIRASRWIALDGPSQGIQIVARRRASTTADEVEVQIREADEPEAAEPARRPPVMEGIVLLGDAYPQPPEASEFSLRSEAPCRGLFHGQFYPKNMFHGPRFQGVASIDRCGDDGVEATMQVLPATDLFSPSGPTAQPSPVPPAFVTDPVLLDALGQVVGFWIAAHPEDSFVAFPFGLKRLQIYGPNLPAGTRGICRARISIVGPQRTWSDIDFLGPDGHLNMQLTGWEDAGFNMPIDFFHFILTPGEVVLSAPWQAPLAAVSAASSLRSYRLDGFPEGFFEAHGRVWKRALAHLVLSRPERQAWSAQRSPEVRRTEWLLGRTVLKDAVRLYLQEVHGMRLNPADIEIGADEHGRPLAQGPWNAGLDRLPILSLAHSGGSAVAVVGDPARWRGVGIDVERLGRAGREGIEDVAFSQQERDLLASTAGTAGEEWSMRLWCAKEAVAKALGRGMIGGPLSLIAYQIEPASGIVSIALAGELARLFPELAGSLIQAYTIRDGDLIAAVSVLERN